MTRAINRRQFFSGDLTGEKAPIRPPWALDEAAFIERCTACGECIATCPYDIIKEGSGKFPQIDFSLCGCDFCQRCMLVCKPGALHYDKEADTSPWDLKATILPSCLSLNAVICRSCGEACDERAIRFKLEVGGVARPLLDQNLCTGCGECFAVCPIRAVEISSIEPREQVA